MDRRHRIIAAGLAIAVAGAVGVLLKVQRDREWVHGGDDVDVAVGLRLADHETFDATVVMLGGPSKHDTGAPPGSQALVVRASWSEAPSDSGHHYALIALDKRVSPPRLLSANGAWVAGDAPEGTGSHWSSAYTELAEHYDWLAKTAMVTDERGVTFPGSAITAPALSSGTLVATWFTDTADGRPPLTDPSAEVIIALVYVDDDGDVRWAKRIFG
ncbi:hypothetical protein [Catellatospora citrea]|uniref:Uncharacterized protein n=1 Tax=Catellatospora citrea TaxID=53366 RepID=A0A8J3KMZ8_9ACTN|nr:hypothetical protein [Catellatospora citrea]RKE05299.1 hypothetical protein C8E86_0094 [Catellatospora citrea]GIF98229.1 hypothetical protein Cci01nite_33230 [Catellatospora citrea]